MKFFWIWVAALCALLLAPAAYADQQNVANEEIDEDKRSVSKLLNEIDDKGDDETLDDENIGEEVIPVLITEKDIEQVKEPEMQRLARHLKSFHNKNVQRSNNNIVVPNSEKDEEVIEERANRRPQRKRRRNTRNKVKRYRNKNRQVENRRKVPRRRMQNKNRNNKVKNIKKRRRNRVRSTRNRRGNNKRRNQKRHPRRPKNRNRKRSQNSRRRNQTLGRKAVNENIIQNANENVKELGIKPAASIKETSSKWSSNVVKRK